MAWIQPIYDRTEDDISRAIELRVKLQARQTLTTAEQAEYNAGLRGTFDYRDHIRVNENMKELSVMFADIIGVNISVATTRCNTKTAYVYTSDINTIEGYLRRFLQAVDPASAALVPTWVSGSSPTYADWNRWELTQQRLYNIVSGAGNDGLFVGEVYPSSQPYSRDQQRLENRGI